MPTTFNFTYTSSTSALYEVADDGEGNLLTGSQCIGQIFYPHGIVVFTSGGFVSMSEDITSNAPPPYPNLNNVKITYSSSFQINEFQYRCVIDENEFTYTLNPTTLQPIWSISTQLNSLVSSITTNTADAANGTFTGVIPTGGSGEGLVLTVTTLGVYGLSYVGGIEVTQRGHGYQIGDVLTISKDDITGTTDVTITLTKENFWIENKNGDIYSDFVSGSYFTPYLTSVGLYNDDQELLAVAKLSTPTPISKFVDTNVYVNLDM